MSEDKIIRLMNEIDTLVVEMDELQECGDLEGMLEKSLEMADLEDQLRAERCGI